MPGLMERETTSRGLNGLGCPSRTSERTDDRDVTPRGGGGGGGGGRRRDD
jgi:hypothetical protein